MWEWYVIDRCGCIMLWVGVGGMCGCGVLWVGVGGRCGCGMLWVV